MTDRAQEERRTRVQGTSGCDASGRGPWKIPPGTITWTEHLEVYEAYAKRFGRDQSAERIAERGGFGKDEAEMVLKRSPEFITEASARALLAQQRWTLARKRADESAEFWQSPRGTDTVLFPLRPDFIDYQRCLVAVVRDVYEDVREARKRRSG